MIGAGKLRTRTAAELRTRYFPKSRIGQGLISVAPWVNIVLLLIFLLLLDRKSVIQPGYMRNCRADRFAPDCGQSWP